MKNAVRRRMNVPALAAQAGRYRRGIQIGPKIRIGGSLGKVGEGVKAVAGKAKDAYGQINPVAGAVYDAVDGKNAGEIGGNFIGRSKTNAEAAAIAGAAYLAPGAIGAIAGSTAGQVGIGAAEMGMDAIKDVLGKGGSIVGDYLKDAAGKVLGKVTDFAKGASPLDVAMIALAAQQGVQSAKASARAGELSDKALKLADDRWATGAPLRDKGMAGLLTPATPDLSATYADPTNPFARTRLNMPASAPPIPRPTPTPLPVTPPGLAPALPRPVDPRKVPAGGALPHLLAQGQVAANAAAAMPSVGAANIHSLLRSVVPSDAGNIHSLLRSVGATAGQGIAEPGGPGASFDPRRMRIPLGLRAV
jgi:hypothetical protein